MTTPTDDHVHLALVPLDGPPSTQCGGPGRSVMRATEVTCPDCLQLHAARNLRMDAEPEVHDTHAIPAGDEPADHAPYIDAVVDALNFAGLVVVEHEALDDEFREAWIKLAPITDHTNPMLTWHELEGWRHGWSDEEQLERGIQCLSDLKVDHLVTHPAAVAAAMQAFYRPVPDDIDEALTALGDTNVEPAKSCPSCQHCGQTFHIEPAKTHDLTIRREHGNVVVRADGETGNRVVYLQDGAAVDLGRVLAVLTPTQRQLLVDDLTGGGS